MEELYDYENDPLEKKNIAYENNYKNIKDGMIKDLRNVIWSK